jgi:hypothetical protein
LRRLRDGIKRFEVPLYVVAAVLGVYLAVATLLRGAKYPTESSWAPWGALFVLMLAAAVFVPLYAFYKALDAHYLAAEKEKGKLQKDLELLCQRVVAELADRCEGVSVNDLSAKVWLCRSDETFDMRASFELAEARLGDGTEWRKGKGIAGTAWAKGETAMADLTELKEDLQSLGEAGFEQLPPGERFGMTAAELKKTLAYAGVCAIPLYSENALPTLLGIFLVDYTGREGFDCVMREVEKRPILYYLAAAEGILTEAEGILPL